MPEYLVRLNYQSEQQSGWYQECSHTHVEADQPYEAKLKAEQENPGMIADQVALIVWKAE